MLVLSRKLGERIVIGDRIVMTVVKLDNGHVRLGIEAPGRLRSTARRSLLASP
jgi:carbon storage regulator